MFLYDTGERITHVLEPNDEHFFEMPVEFAAIPPLARFCKIDKFPDIGQGLPGFVKKVLIADFLKITPTATGEMNFRGFVTKMMLTVDLEFADEKRFEALCEETKKEQLAVIAKLKEEEASLPLISLTYAENPIMIADIAPKPNLPPIKAKVRFFLSQYR